MDEGRLRTRVLFIERHAATRVLVLAAFDALRYKLAIAEGAEGALAIRAHASRFDVLLCELGAPGIEEPRQLGRFAEWLDHLARCAAFIAADEVQRRGVREILPGRPVLTQPLTAASLRDHVDALIHAAEPHHAREWQ